MPTGLKDHKFKLVSIDHEVEIYTGDDVTLLCRLSPATSAVAMEIRWFKGTECIYLYRNGQVMEAKSYDGRFNVNTKALQRGDVSLRLWESEEAYEDKYTCQVIYGEQREEKRLVLKYNGDTGVMYAETGKNTDRHKKRMEESVQNLVRCISPSSGSSSSSSSVSDQPKDAPVSGGGSPGPVSPVSPVVSELRLVRLQGSAAGKRAAANTILGTEQSGKQAEEMGSGNRERFYSSETYQEAEKQLRDKENRMQKEQEVEERKPRERRDELDTNMHESLKKLEVEKQARAEAERNLMNISRQMEEKNREIEEKSREVKEKNREIEEKSREVKEKNREIEEKSREVKEKNRVIEEKNRVIERVQQLAEKDRSAGEKKTECDRQELKEKDREIERLKGMLEKKDIEIERMRLKQKREDSVVQNGCLKQITLKLNKDIDTLRKVLDSFSDTKSLLREMCKNE